MSGFVLYIYVFMLKDTICLCFFSVLSENSGLFVVEIGLFNFFL
ncbi:hypothetical protein SAMN04488089_103156 [Myroides profundi]|uniref:Uncharacterized protein n=1 Tax=Myroides profundi TaxID=480520 RepID=A0AAJ5BD81_MYRPR|nr:hypothetical protein SAMN04488089_103156 [Myroides profundi]